MRLQFCYQWVKRRHSRRTTADIYFTLLLGLGGFGGFRGGFG